MLQVEAEEMPKRAEQELTLTLTLKAKTLKP